MLKYLTILPLLFAFPAQSSDLDCEKAKTTVESNECAAIERDAAYDKMVQYFETSLKQFPGEQDLLREMKMAQRQWDSYMNTHCNSVYTLWSGGSIRTQMALACETRLIKVRTHELWSEFLTYIDSTQPVLPKP